MMRRLNFSIMSVCIALAAISYSSWVLEFVLPTGLDPMRSFLSELDAAGRPYGEVFSVGDKITGSLSLIGAALGLWLLPNRRWITAGFIALGLFGGATIADALAPIECIPGIDAGCPSTPSGLLPQLHHIHALTSSIAVFAIFVCMTSFTVATYRYRLWPLLRRAGAAVFAVVTVSTAWMLIADNLPGYYALGLAQRIQIAGMTVWLVLLAWSVRDRDTERHGTRFGRTQGR